FIDSKQAIDHRMECPANERCDRDVMEFIEGILEAVNPYYESCKMMAEVEQEAIEEAERKGEEPPEIKLLFDINTDDLDKRRYNIPKTNEVRAIFVVDENDEVPAAEGLAIHQRGEDIKFLSKFEKRAESMLYPL